jgi:hypothetical protein
MIISEQVDKGAKRRRNVSRRIFVRNLFRPLVLLIITVQDNSEDNGEDNPRPNGMTKNSQFILVFSYFYLFQREWKNQ